jgi:DNA-directed RNA polymerase specialized sigma24 family protein
VQEDPLFEQFVAERVDGLLRYGYVLTGNPHDAADLVQEALVRLRGSWSRVRRKSALDGYVRTTMTRLHINSWPRAGAPISGCGGLRRGCHQRR